MSHFHVEFYFAYNCSTASLRPGLTSCSILLSTQLLYSFPLLINDISLLVSNGTNCWNLFHPIRILASTAASASPSRTYPLFPDLHWHQCPHLYNRTDYRIRATSTNKWLHHFVRATLYTTTLLVYRRLTVNYSSYVQWSRLISDEKCVLLLTEALNTIRQKQMQKLVLMSYLILLLSVNVSISFLFVHLIFCGVGLVTYSYCYCN